VAAPRRAGAAAGGVGVGLVGLWALRRREGRRWAAASWAGSSSSSSGGGR
jgi:hypothetical protein